MTPGVQNPDGPAAQPLRSDAERNRERITAAARTVFAQDGLNASMASVAREAGVGIATMFRRFPTKAELVDAVFSGRMGAYADAVTTALEDPDPWHGFVGYIETACAMQAADNGFADVLTTTFPTARPWSSAATRRTRPWSSSSTGPRPQAGCARTSTPRTWC
ncbi:TetR/AcrR family transcriptional regulator [Streptomyces caelestis]|jgi:AcrR family transcriptional regulator|uniref:TetR/AcrR family transcriptional regulator n=1 Tax=Streptomyces caelestis TaxID=36816 RepID=UPI003701606F